MRHSDINLTMNRYTHIFRGQESAAVESMPDLSLPSTQAQRAIMTGTDGEKNLAFCLAQQDGFERSSANTGELSNRNGGVKTAESKANGRIRTDNPWFTKPELCH